MRRRRALLTLAAAAFAPWARAQSPSATSRPRKLAILWMAPEEFLRRDILPDLQRELAGRGYVVGKNLNIVIEVSHPRVIAAGAAAVAAQGPDVVVTMGTTSTRAMMLAAPGIPVVTSVADPVGSGFARTLARPGGNVTGLSQGKFEATRKGLEALRELDPRLSRLAIVGDDSAGGREFGSLISRAAVELGIEPLPIVVRPGDLLVGLARAAQSRASGIFLNEIPAPDAYVRFAGEAVRARLPVITNHEEGVDAGLLASYNSERVDWAQRTAAIADRMLRGGDPATTPFELPERYRFVVNRTTAAALGLAIPPDLALRVDRFVG